ncbi:hypothetical protein GHT06_019813 [Daphnia sinensis]|uniref:Uncharacterized protein n=1 Tax=Daphnia sinensis TaxID=1820382 RepID=A0AAD5L3F9_9CRUS|nr:hypothetical protein GHT06_019813 [Daphnia sinensis]
MRQKQVRSRVSRYADTIYGMIPFHTRNYLCVTVELFVQSRTREHNKHLLRCHSDTLFYDCL